MGVQLNAVTGRNRYCGPTALATVLGVTTDEASRMIRAVTGKPYVMGVHERDLFKALLDAGCRARLQLVHAPVKERPTLVTWARKNRKLFGRRHVIVLAGHHYGTFLGTGYLCSLTGREVVGLDELPKPMSRVAGWIVVEDVPDTVPVPPPSPPPSNLSPARKEVLSLAKEHGVDAERDSAGVIWVYPPAGLYDPEDGDPYYGEHCCDDWDEARERVERYIRDAAAAK